MRELQKTSSWYGEKIWDKPRSDYALRVYTLYSSNKMKKEYKLHFKDATYILKTQNRPLNI